MSRAPTRATPAGRAYLALQKKARADRRPTDELLQLYALEAFIDRLSTSDRGRGLVLKGGVLLAAYEMRRPTRDVDLSARNVPNTVEATVELIGAIASEPRDDGWSFGVPSGESIRADDEYSGVRVTIPGQLASARVSFHVDVNFGDPVWPEPREVSLPRLLGGTISVRGYPLEMVHAEKIITAIQRGTANTRWRDFADIYLLSGHHPVDADTLLAALRRVAEFRQAELVLLREVLDGYAELAQGRWAAWVRKQRLGDRLPADFSEVLRCVREFADGLVETSGTAAAWDPASRMWRKR